MLRTGVILWLSSFVTVALRFADISLFTGPNVHFLCLAGLSLSLVCFIATYYLYESSRRKRLYVAARPKPHQLLIAHSAAH